MTTKEQNSYSRKQQRKYKEIQCVIDYRIKIKSGPTTTENIHGFNYILVVRAAQIRNVLLEFLWNFFLSNWQHYLLNYILYYAQQGKKKIKRFNASSFLKLHQFRLKTIFSNFTIWWWAVELSTDLSIVKSSEIIYFNPWFRIVNSNH